MFSALESMLGGFRGLRVLDLYSGSGALGLEALSRGAIRVTLVESDVRAVRTIEANVAAVDLPGASIVHDRVERFLSTSPGRGPDMPDARQEAPAPVPGAGSRTPASSHSELHGRREASNDAYDVVLADPPYALATDELEHALARLADGWLAPDAVVVIERDRRSGPIRWPVGMNGLRERAYGETVLWYGRSAGTEYPAGTE
jgi:16S rRNA (guanine966-N2)-methyltransferase